ncbi:MAG: hypothetical protein VW270_29215, partial [Candidatus Poseidoniales archaeon]
MVSFPADLGGGREKYKGTINFRASSTSTTFAGSTPTFAGQSPRGGGTKTVKKASPDSRGNSGVTLYLPQAVNIADQVGYENIDLGFIGMTAMNTAKSAMAAAGSGASASGAISQIINDVTSSISDQY